MARRPGLYAPSTRQTWSEIASASSFRPETFDDVRELSADKAYISKRNLRAVMAVGATPYIPFKANSTPSQSHHKFDGLWSRMWHFYLNIASAMLGL